MKLPRKAKRMARKATRPDPKVLASAVGAGLALGAAATAVAAVKGPAVLKEVNARLASVLEKRTP